MGLEPPWSVRVVWSASRSRGSGGRAAERTSGDNQRTLTVIGHGSVSIPPDAALVALGIRVTAANARAASAQGNAALQRILAAVKEHGIAERQIHTTRFNISPEYRHEEHSAQPVQYRVTSSLHVTVNDLAQVGELLDAVVGAGEDHVMIQDVSLLTRDTHEAEARARSAALAHAREKAEQIARDAGVTLGEMQSITEELGGMRMPRMAMSYFDATSIQTGETEVSAALEVVWAMA